MTYKYHTIKKGTAVIVTLHGTGANMHDLDLLAEAIQPEATIIGLEGDVNEHGMLRWFKRFSPGVFDEDDLFLRAKKLSSWLPELAKQEGFLLSDALFVGFSNGANMLAALLQLYPGIIKKAALLHGQLPLDKQPVPSQKATVFVSAGKTDRMIPYAQSEHLAKELQKAGITVQFFAHPYGHTITEEEIVHIRDTF